MAEDSNKSKKNYIRYAMTSMDVMFNGPIVKRVKTKQVPIMWTDYDENKVLYPHKDALVN